MKFINSVKKVKVIATFLSLFLTLSIVSAQSNTGSTAKKKAFVVVIDPGHGGNKPGAYGSRSKEKDIVLDVSKKLKTALENDAENFKVILTRSTDVDVEFWRRTDIANKNHADIFISIHANSADRDVYTTRKGRKVKSVQRNPGVKGTETLVLGFNRLNEQDAAIRENADMYLEENYKENYKELGDLNPNDPSSYIVFKLLKRQYRSQSIKLASLMQTEYTNNSRSSRGVKEQGLAVLSKAGMPAVLTEIGFISSPTEEDYMLSESGQNEIAQNLLHAIKKYKASVEK